MKIIMAGTHRAAAALARELGLTAREWMGVVPSNWRYVLRHRYAIKEADVYSAHDAHLLPAIAFILLHASFASSRNLEKRV